MYFVDFNKISIVIIKYWIYIFFKYRSSVKDFAAGHIINRYIRQFREIFTEEGRRQVKITHQAPGQVPTVIYTQALHAAAASGAAQPAVQVAHTAENNAVSQPSVVSSVTSNVVQVCLKGFVCSYFYKCNVIYVIRW